MDFNYKNTLRYIIQPNMLSVLHYNTNNTDLRNAQNIGY